MNQIKELPTEKDFGLEFNYAVWTADTKIQLCNVPWNSDYRDVWGYDNPTQFDNYLINQNGPVINGGTRHRVSQPVRLSIPFTRAYTYNYMRVYNPASPVGDSARAYYYFIQDVRSIAGDTTEFAVQLDVWATFGNDIQFGNCFIESGHVGIANEKAFDNHGRDFLTVPEGLDIGGEYQIIQKWTRELATARAEAKYSIMVIANTALDASPGTVQEPNQITASGSNMENLPNAADIWVFDDFADFGNFLNSVKDKPWVTQGIISIMAIPPVDIYGIKGPRISVGSVIATKVGGSTLKVRETKLKTNWRDSVAGAADFPERYRHLKKFLTFPYCALELTTNNGTPIIIKPESWNDDDATIIEVPHFAPPSARLAFYPYRYNAANSSVVERKLNPDTEIQEVMHDGGEFLDMATGIFNFPTFSILNNGYLQMMASQAHSMAFQHQSADWSQQKALSGNSMAYDQASASMDMSSQMTNMGINAAQSSTNLANQTAGLSALTGAVGGIAGGIAGGPAGLAGGVGNAAMSGANLAIGINQRNQQLAIGNQLARGTSGAQAENAAYMRDTNKGYADYAARGDYQNQIAGINAKVQDAKLTQPTTSGQVGGDAFNLAQYRWGYDLKVKMLHPAAMAIIGEYWLRYGYAVQRFGKVSNLKVMSKFSYWKLRETYIISSACPESFKQAIRGIFEKGVTVWNNPADIGNVDIADNAPISGIRL